VLEIQITCYDLWHFPASKTVVFKSQVVFKLPCFGRNPVFELLAAYLHWAFLSSLQPLYNLMCLEQDCPYPATTVSIVMLPLRFRSISALTVPAAVPFAAAAERCDC